MPDPTPAYSREATVAAIHDFYLFLTRLPGLNPSDIISAPESGFPELTDAFLSKLGKNSLVNDLIRHLPYIAGNNKIAPETSAIQYNGPDTLWSLDRNIILGTLTPYGAGTIPPHVAVLTEAGRYGSWLLLDTVEGTVTDYIQFGRPERDVPDSESPDHWRAYRTLPVEDFFEEWKDNYRRAEWVVVPEDDDDGVMYRFDAETEVIFLRPYHFGPLLRSGAL